MHGTYAELYMHTSNLHYHVINYVYIACLVLCRCESCLNNTRQAMYALVKTKLNPITL